MAPTQFWSKPVGSSLKKKRNLTRQQRHRRDDLLQYNLRRVRAYLLRLDFEHLWTFQLPTRAEQFLDHWCRRAMRSRLDRFKTLAKIFRTQPNLMYNYFQAKKAFTSGGVEGLNDQAKLDLRRGLGFKSEKTR